VVRDSGLRLAAHRTAALLGGDDGYPASMVCRAQAGRAKSGGCGLSTVAASPGLMGGSGKVGAGDGPDHVAWKGFADAVAPVATPRGEQPDRSRG
jgi:hypothetical protein